MSRDTLLIVTTSYPDQRDGSEAAGAFVADLAGHLAQHLPVRVVAPGRVVGPCAASPGEVSVSRFASPGKPLSLLSPTRPGDWPDILRTLSSLRAQTLAADSDGRVKHVLALWVLPSGWAAAAVARSSGIPYTVWALGSDIWSLGRLPLVRSILARVIRGANGRFADGLQLAQDASAIARLSFEFLPSTRQLAGARARSGEPGTAPYRVIFLGRWHPNKGVDLLLDALDRLEEADWLRLREVHIAGGGPMESAVQARVKALKLQGRPIRLSGYLDTVAASAAIAESDWLLIPSRIESIPLVFSDAMKLGCPVVSMPVGDLKVLIESEPSCGVVAADVTAASFARALSHALQQSPADYDAGIAIAAKRFDLESIACRILSTIHGPAGDSRQQG